MKYITCKEFAKQHKQELKAKFDEIKKLGGNPDLTVFQVGDNPASNKYISGKLKDCNEVGIRCKHVKLNGDIDQVTLKKLIRNNYRYDMALAMVQLPLPKEFDIEDIIGFIGPNNDVDGMGKNAICDPCTPKGILMYLDANGIDLAGKNAVVIGRSDIVGKPMARMLTERNCTVTLCHSRTKDISLYTKNADLIIVAVGKRNLLTPDMINPDRKPIVIDVGINVKEDGKLCGDCDYEGLKEYCELITPVPGGVGLLTRVALLDNVLQLYSKYQDANDDEPWEFG